MAQVHYNINQKITFEITMQIAQMGSSNLKKIGHTLALYQIFSGISLLVPLSKRTKQDRLEDDYFNYLFVTKSTANILPSSQQQPLLLNFSFKFKRTPIVNHLCSSGEGPSITISKFLGCAI